MQKILFKSEENETFQKENIKGKNSKIVPYYNEKIQLIDGFCTVYRVCVLKHCHHEMDEAFNYFFFKF